MSKFTRSKACQIKTEKIIVKNTKLQIQKKSIYISFAERKKEKRKNY